MRVAQALQHGRQHARVVAQRAARPMTTSAAGTMSQAWQRQAAIGAGVLGSGLVGAWYAGYFNASAYGSKNQDYLADMPKGHCARPDLPFFTIKEVKQHTSVEDGLWVTWKGGVYDVTSFVQGHPGGSGRIIMASGNDLSIFWEIYRMHFRTRIFEFIERFRIGNLSPCDAIKMETEFTFDDPYVNDPKRVRDLLATLQRPFCGEPRLRRVAESFYTPNELHYVRLHLPVPDMSPDEWEVTVSGNGVEETTYSLKDIQEKFQHHEVSCTLQCAGNRREDFNRDGNSVYISPSWRVSAMSNAKYKGVYVRDLLADCGLPVKDIHNNELSVKQLAPFKHIQYESYDTTETGLNYGISIPVEKAVDPRGDCMLVWEMNGKPLPRDHGAPVRALTPGMVGNKSAKFLKDIIVADDISYKPWHCKAYRNFPPDTTFEEHLSKWDTLSEDFLSKGPIAYLMPVQSFISEPQAVDVIGVDRDTQSVKVKGVAWTGNGVGIARVDVSMDGGKNFTAADLHKKPKEVAERETHNRMWTWSIFEKDIPLTAEQKLKLSRGQKIDVNLVSKGVDNAFNVQPSEVGPYYNPRGVTVNNWYHVPVTLDPKKRTGSVKHVDGEDGFNPPTGGHFVKPWDRHGWTSEEADWHQELLDANKKHSGKCKNKKYC